jgi:hypothetical protein
MPVYEYQGQNYELPEGLSNEQALSKIKAHLGETVTTKQEAAPSQEPSMASEVGRQLGLTARAGVTGLSTVPNAVADFLAGAANLGLEAAGSETRVPYLSQVQQQALKESYFPQPREGLEQKVQTASEAVAGMMTPGLKVPMAQQAEGATARDIAARGLSEAAGVAAGAVAGEEAAKKATELTGSPWAGLAAGLATGTIVGSGVGKTAFAVSGPRTEPVTIDQIRRRASQGYQAMDDAKVTIASDSVKNKLLPKVLTELDQNNYDPAIVKAHGAIEDNLKLLDKLVSAPSVDFTRLEKVRSAFSGLAAGTDDTARLAKIVTNNIDSFLANLGSKDVKSKVGANPQDALKSLEQARSDWRNQSRAQVLQDILDSSTARIEGATGPTGDIIKRNLVNLTANVDKMKMFSTREQNIIKAAAKATDMETLLSILAKFNPERGFAQSAIASSALTGSVLGQGPASTASLGYLGAAGGGYVADKALAAMRQREIKNLISQVASGNLQPPKESFAVPGLFGATSGVMGQ